MAKALRVGIRSSSESPSYEPNGSRVPMKSSGSILYLSEKTSASEGMLMTFCESQGDGTTVMSSSVSQLFA